MAAWGDYDNDGRLDLFVACNGGTSALCHNLGNGEFECPVDASTFSGTEDNFTAWVDYDNDGFLDLWVSQYRSGNKLFHNNGNANSWLTVKPVGTVSNRDGVGAKVRVLATYAGQARWQRRDITGGTTSNGNHRYAHFGLSDATKIDTLRVEWPSGIVQELQDVPPKQILTITEPPQLVPLGPDEFQIRCWKGMQFEVQKSANLETWNSLGTVTNVTGTLTFQDTQGDPGTASCFYRVVSQ